MSFDTVEKLQLLASSAVYNHCFLVKKYIKIHDSVMSFFRDGCDHVRLNYARRISHSSWVAPAPLGLRAEEMQPLLPRENLFDGSQEFQVDSCTAAVTNTDYLFLCSEFLPNFVCPYIVKNMYSTNDIFEWYYLRAT